MTEEHKRKNNIRLYARYSGMAAEIFILLLILLFLGKKLDAYMNNEKAYFTASFIIIGLFAYLYKIYKEISKSKD